MVLDASGFFSVKVDIKVKEQTIENLMKGNKKFEPPRFMTVSQAAQQLMEIVESKSTGNNVFLNISRQL